MTGFKKVLLIDTTLHRNDATGITLSNLFCAWPKDKLFMIGTPEMVELSSNDGYKNTYVIGSKDYNHKFPLGFLVKIVRLFYRQADPKETISTIVIKTDNTSLFRTWELSLKVAFTSLFKYLGLDHLLFRQIISEELRDWIKKSDPDFFYAVLSSRHSIHFATNMVQSFNKPLIVHIMDDWPATIGCNSVFGEYWNSKINSEFRVLLNNTSKRLAISDLMASEYSNRYGGDWEYFHNPVVLENWKEYQKSEVSLPKDSIKIGYFGRIGRANEQSIKLFIKVISSGEIAVPVEFHLFTNLLSKQPLNEANVIYHSFLEHALMPPTISSFDFLLLPISFLDEDVIFAKYSIPTKLSEYLISGVPIIVLAPKNIALSEFVRKYNCGLSINTMNVSEITKILNNFLLDLPLQNVYSKNGKDIATNEFEINSVGKKFTMIFDTGE